MIDVNEYHSCERCKIQQALFFCQECQPFKEFCSKCDTSVHSLPSKRNHRRETMKWNINNQNNPEKEKDNVVNSKTAQEPERTTSNTTMKFNPASNYISINTNSTSKPMQNELYDNNPNQCQYSYYPSVNVSYIESKYHEGGRVYTKEYVNELKNLFEKEKNELLFKINSLQRNLDRLKVSFTDQLQKMHSSAEEANNKNTLTIRMIEEENEAALRRIIEEKENKIENLSNKLEEFKQCNEELIDKLEENIRSGYKNQEKYNKIVNDFNQTIEEQQKLEVATQNEHENKIGKIVKNSQTEKEELMLQHRNEVNNVITENQRKYQKMQLMIDDRERDIKDLMDKKREDDDYYNKVINELNAENNLLKENLRNLQADRERLDDNRKSLEGTLASMKNENEITIRSLERNRKENMRNGEEIAFLENAITNLKNENFLLNENNSKLQKEYDYLFQTSENSRQEFLSRMSDMEYLQNQNILLRRENEELSKKLARYDRIYSGIK